MMFDRKKALTQIMGEDPKVEKGEADGLPSEVHSCMQEFISCVHEHDVDGALDSLRALVMQLELEPKEG